MYINITIKSKPKSISYISNIADTYSKIITLNQSAYFSKIYLQIHQILYLF
jgi:hypothetical protein